jgi:hypothetical protein
MLGLIRGGTDDHSRRADVLIRDGAIAAVGADLEAPAGALTHSEIAWLDGQLRAEAGAAKNVAREPFLVVRVANATWRVPIAPRQVERAHVTP